MEPHRALFSAHRSDKRPSIRSQNDSFFFGGGGSDLVRVSLGKALAPDVETASHVRREIHPVPVGRPRRIGALAGNRPHRLAGRTSVERNQAARQPPSGVHLDHQDPFVVRGKIGAVSHAELAGRRPVHIAFLGPAFSGGRDFHVQPLGYFREHYALISNPGQSGSIRQHAPGGSAWHGYNPGVPIPAIHGRVRNSRSVRRKDRAQFGQIVVSNLERLSIGQELYIHLAGAIKGVLSADERQHTAIGRERRGSYGIRVTGQLGVLLRWSRDLSPAEHCQSSHQEQYDGGDCQSTGSSGPRSRCGAGGWHLPWLVLSRRKIHLTNRRDETVAAFGYSLDVLRSILTLAQDLAQNGDVPRQIAFLNERAWPDFL